VDASVAEIRGFEPLRDELRMLEDYMTMRAEKYAMLERIGQSRHALVLEGYVAHEDAAALEERLARRFDCAVEIAPAADDPDAPIYKIRVTFENDCKMENVRAFGVVNSLKPYCLKIVHYPENLMSNDASEQIIKNGFVLYIKSNENPDNLKEIINSVMFMKTFSLILLAEDNDDIPEAMTPKKDESAEKSGGPVKQATELITKQNFISVNINKLNKLMDLVGEIVTTESMVTKNPEILNLKLESFDRSAQQLRKLINELQDIVMSVRMVPVSSTFHKMQRIVRDMSKKVNKEVDLQIIGEETEIDKNIIDTLSDPLMHLIRNAVDHGIESPKNANPWKTDDRKAYA
jgi:two-component system chemotaxis sensor kinase CheA